MDGGEPAAIVIRVVVPGPPRPLERNRHRIVTPRGKPSFVGSYLPTKSRNEKAVIRDFAAQAMAGRSPIEGPIDLRIAAYMPVPASWSHKKRALAISGGIRPAVGIDFDNIMKLAADAFKHVVWRDDSQVTDAVIWKRYSDRPRIVIEVRPIIL